MKLMHLNSTHVSTSRTQRGVYGIVAACALITLFAASAVRSETAIPADWIPDSVGINTHFWNWYEPYQANAGVRNALKNLQVRHIRDSASPQGSFNPAYIADLKDLAASGIRADLICDPRSPGDTAQNSINWINANVRNACEAVEGPNEYDTNPGGGASYQQQLFSAARNAFGTSVPVYGLSFVSTSSYAAAGNLTNYLDCSNSHPYQSWRNPETTGWDGNYNGYGSLPWQIANTNHVQSPSKPMVATETGYNAVASDTWGSYVPDSVAAKYILRATAQFLMQGYQRTYKYDLLDDSSGKWGLLSSASTNGGYTARPSFYALANLISILKEPGRSFTPGALSFTINGNPTNISHLLTQKSNGDYYLLLWQNTPSYAGDASAQEIYNPDVNVTISLPSTIQSAQSILPYGPNTWNNIGISSSTINVSVPDSMVIVKLTGSGGVVSNGNHTLTPVCATGARLDANGAGTANGTKVQIWTAYGNGSQTWTFTNMGGNIYKIQPSYVSGMALDVNGGGSANGTIVQLWQDNGSNAQRWAATAVPGGYTFTPLCAPGARLDVTGGWSANGTQIEIWPANGTGSQTWVVN